MTRSDYTEHETCEVHGLPATSSTRTMADLARRLPIIEAVVLLDMALRAGLVGRSELDEWIAENDRKRGIGRLKSALGLAEPASESPMESRLRLVLVTAGLERPSVQATLSDDSGLFIARPDLYFHNARLVIEYDGGTHRENLVADNRRQNRLIEGGYRVLRFTAGDVLHRPASVVAQVRRALAA